MKYTLLPVITGILLISSVGSVQAEMYQEQSQKSSHSFSFSSSCKGNDCGTGEVSFKSKSKIKQSQSQSYGQTARGWHTPHKYSNNGSSVPVYGSATIYWDKRGGTCQIRYSESNVNHYKYFTTAACDDGQATIGGLQRGATYRFQVRKDEGWSAPVWVRAS